MRVQSTPEGSITTYYASSSYVVEVDGETTTVKKTYMAGSISIAVRTIVGESNTLNWVLGDHLGSSSVTTTDDGTWYSELRYSAFGETRYSSGITPTDYRYTGQLEQADVNLYYYNARWYDPELGRFIQADTIVPEPGRSKSYDRYTYVNNNPVRYTDPSGHRFDLDSGAGAYVPYVPWKWVMPTVKKNTSTKTSNFDTSPSTPVTSLPADIYVFTGYLDGPVNPGPSAEIQIPILDRESIVTEFGCEYVNVRYPGEAAGGKQAQAEIQLGIDIDNGNIDPKILYCYSAGNESCVMYAEKAIKAGIPILGIAFIGGSFEAEENGITYTSEVWKKKIENLYDSGVSVMIVNDYNSTWIFGDESYMVFDDGKTFSNMFVGYGNPKYGPSVVSHGEYSYPNQILGPFMQQVFFGFAHSLNR